MSSAIEVTQGVLLRVAVERQRQDHKWDVRDLPDCEWLAIFIEELGEAMKDSLEGRCPKQELVQAASVIVAWIESVDRRAG